MLLSVELRHCAGRRGFEAGIRFAASLEVEGATRLRKNEDTTCSTGRSDAVDLTLLRECDRVNPSPIWTTDPLNAFVAQRKSSWFLPNLPGVRIPPGAPVRCAVEDRLGAL